MDKDVFEYCDMRGIELPEAYTKEGCDRTGCVACGFGITRKGDDRLDILYRHYPKYYAMIMDYKNNGVTYREAVRKVLESAGKTLPDERPQTLFDT